MTQSQINICPNTQFLITQSHAKLLLSFILFALLWLAPDEFETKMLTQT